MADIVPVAMDRVRPSDVTAVAGAELVPTHFGGLRDVVDHCRPIITAWRLAQAFLSISLLVLVGWYGSVRFSV
jgi:hypothetical protein